MNRREHTIGFVNVSLLLVVSTLINCVNLFYNSSDKKTTARKEFASTDSQLEQLKIMKHQVIIYTYMTYFLNSISNNGNYISIACNEAENRESLTLLSSFVKEKELTIYTNTNKSYIDLKVDWINSNDPIIDPKTKKQMEDLKTKEKMYNSYPELDNIARFFRVPLTSTFINKLGWVKSQISKDKTINITDTRKDLILNNYQQNKKSFELITSGTYTKDQINKILFYYSKKYKSKAVQLWGKNHYNAWRKTI